MADNTKQFRWIVLLFALTSETLEVYYPDGIAEGKRQRAKGKR
jgi:hypothetical protein